MCSGKSDKNILFQTQFLHLELTERQFQQRNLTHFFRMSTNSKGSVVSVRLGEWTFLPKYSEIVQICFWHLRLKPDLKTYILILIGRICTADINICRE